MKEKAPKREVVNKVIKENLSPEELEEYLLNRSAKFSKQNKANRSKGHRFEREIVQAFRRTFPEARRNLEFQKEAAAAGVDLINTGRWRIQCKRGKQYVSVTKINEVKICPIEAGCPVLLTKADNKPILAVLPFDELLALIRFKERHDRRH